MTRAAFRWIPNAMSATRLAMAPALLACAAAGTRRGFAIALGIALVTDAVDGRVARALDCVTVNGARLDSWGDLALYSTGPIAIVLLWPHIVAREAAGVATVLLALAGPVALGLVKFRRLTSYHTWAAKTAAVVLSLSLVPLLLGASPWPFRAAAVVLVAAAVEEVAITLTLTEWHADVPTVWHARRLARARVTAPRAL